MLERDYDGVRAYCQSKLAQILLTVDLAVELEGTDVTATALHPATYMPTKMVPSPTSTLEEGVRATRRLVADPALDGVSGRYFDGQREAEPPPAGGGTRTRGGGWGELSERLVAEAGRLNAAVPATAAPAGLLAAGRWRANWEPGLTDTGGCGSRFVSGGRSHLPAGRCGRRAAAPPSRPADGRRTLRS